MKRLLIPLALAVAASPALADIEHNGKVIDCYCTDSTGGRVDLGEKICLHVDGKMFTAQCQMSLNVPMWREVQEGCLSSGLQQSKPSLDPVAIDAEIPAAKS